MKLKRWSQSILAVTALIGAGLGLVSCGTSNTVDYLYAVSAKNNPGQVNAYRVDSQSGALTQIPDSPFPAGRNPVSLAVDGAGQSLYVANHDDNSIIQFGIGTDAKLYGQHTVNPSGSEPVSVTVHSYFDAKSNNYLGSLVYVVETFQPNFTDLNQGPGGLYVYRIPPGAAIGTPVPQTVNGVTTDYYPLGMTPTAANATVDGLHVYATDILATGQTGNGCGPGQGAVEGFTVAGAVDSISPNGATITLPSGVITPVVGNPFCSGVSPSAITSHPFASFLYVTDSTQNLLITYHINTSKNADGTLAANTGQLTTLPNSIIATGTFPDGVVSEQTGQYVYVANGRGGGTVSGYAVNKGTGQLSALTTGGGGVTDAGPGCIIVEPALSRFLYTANFTGGSLSGFTIDPSNGSLAATQNTPYPTSGLSGCTAATSHGNHPIIHVQDTPG